MQATGSGTFDYSNTGNGIHLCACANTCVCKKKIHYLSTNKKLYAVIFTYLHFTHKVPSLPNMDLPNTLLSSLAMGLTAYNLPS
jgi:hypothetical protein